MSDNTIIAIMIFFDHVYPCNSSFEDSEVTNDSGR